MPPFHSQLRCTTLGLCAEMWVEGGPAQREGTPKKSYLEAERRSSSAGWRRDGAEQKRARAFVDFRKDVTKFFPHASFTNFRPIPSNFIKTPEFSFSAAEFITHPFVIHVARPHISGKIALAKFPTSISFPFHISSYPTIISIYLYICKSNSSLHPPTTTLLELLITTF